MALSTAKSLKELNSRNHGITFTQMFDSIERRISFNPRWATDVDQTDLSKIVLDPLERLILQPGEYLACSYDRNGSKHDRRVNKTFPRDVLKSPIIVFGTPYGTGCIHYLRATKKTALSSFATNAMQNALVAIYSGEIHMTEPLRNAVMAVLERKPELLNMITDAKVRKNIDLETFAKYFVLTEGFMAEINEQADVDRAGGKVVSDGFAPIVRAKVDRRQQKNRRAFTGPGDTDRRQRKDARRKAPEVEAQQVAVPAIPSVEAECLAISI